jgi:3-deoxy-manno-octulosonate cytidylyltransferase (CMP-KDO synthetase)
VKLIVGIPARMGSSRLPGKPLAPILGMPMIEHVYRRCQLADGVDELFVATCDEEIRSVVEDFGGRALMTPKDIARAGLRVAEASKQLDLGDDDIVIVAQGDEPLVHPDMVSLTARVLEEDAGIHATTLVGDATEEEWLDPNEVKIVAAANDDILYMSRSPIPSDTRDRVTARLKQISILGFRKKALFDFQELEPTPLEDAESIELLRALEHGLRVRGIRSPYPSVAVDTEADRLRAEEAMRTDVLYAAYGR